MSIDFNKDARGVTDRRNIWVSKPYHIIVEKSITTTLRLWKSVGYRYRTENRYFKTTLTYTNKNQHVNWKWSLRK